MNRMGDGSDKRSLAVELRPKGDARNVALDKSEKDMKIEKRMKLAGIIAGVSAIVFAIPHFWFWFGVSLAYPGDFPNLYRSDALLYVGGFAIIAAIYAIVFTRASFVRRLPELIAALPAWFGAIGFTIWGLLFFSLQIQIAIYGIQSAPQYAANNASPNAIWGYYWYSLFIVWGLSLGVSAFYFHKLKKNQKQSKNEGKSAS
jgi:hypothetical protein